MACDFIFGGALSVGIIPMMSACNTVFFNDGIEVDI